MSDCFVLYLLLTCMKKKTSGADKFTNNNHMQAKVVSRGSGRSAVAASAYMSCSRMYNDYDGIQHDYTRKHGLIYQEVLLPPMASPE